MKNRFFLFQRIAISIFISTFIWPPLLPAAQQNVRRLGVVDVDAPSLLPVEKDALLNLLRSRLQDQRTFALPRQEEIDAKLVEKNALRAETEKLRNEHDANRVAIENQIKKGRDLYLSSRFEDAIPILQSALISLKDASLAINSKVPNNLVTLMAACYFFMGNQDQARTYLNALLDLDPAALLDAQQYPPPIIALFNQCKKSPRYLWKKWTFDSSVRGIRAYFLGYPLDVQEGEHISISLPLDHPIWGAQSIVLEKDGYAPFILSIDNLPNELRFLSIRDRRKQTSGIFAPVGTLEIPADLKKLSASLDLSVVFLGSAIRDLKGVWILKGQWAEPSTGRVSPIVTASDNDMQIAVNKLLSELLLYLSPEGAVLSQKRLAATTPRSAKGFKTRTPDFGETSEQRISPPFYKTWWFWTAVGAGLVGAGVGTYFLVKPDDTLKFSVVPK